MIVLLIMVCTAALLFILPGHLQVWTLLVLHLLATTGGFVKVTVLIHFWMEQYLLHPRFILIIKPVFFLLITCLQIVLMRVGVVQNMLFAVAFVLRGAARIDPQADGGSWGFRLAILPGVAVLWPLLARRWARRQAPPEERNAHRDLAASGGGR